MPDWLTPHLQAIFQAILTRELPLLFHCSAGKDRTGFCTAIIYGLLDVPEETVYEEYLLTNEFSDLYAFTKKHRASGMGVTDAAHPIDQMEPERLFSFRWHPYAIDRAVDYSAEPTTLIVFALEKVASGVMLTVTESGFDRIPLERRAKAFTANEQGWGMVVTLIDQYLMQTQQVHAQ